MLVKSRCGSCQPGHCRNKPPLPYTALGCRAQRDAYNRKQVASDSDGQCCSGGCIPVEAGLTAATSILPYSFKQSASRFKGMALQFWEQTWGTHLVPDVDDVAAVVTAVDAARLGAAAEAAMVAVVLRQAEVVHGQHMDVIAWRAAFLQPAHDVRVVVVFPVRGCLACHLARKLWQVLRDCCTGTANEGLLQHATPGNLLQLAQVCFCMSGPHSSGCSPLWQVLCDFGMCVDLLLSNTLPSGTTEQ